MAFSGAGTGLISDPYVITTASQLQEMGNAKSAYYVLGNDIDASDTVNWNGGAGFAVIGSQSWDSFSGSLDGAGFKVVGLVINRPTTDMCGMFGVANGASIKNITFEDVSISGLARAALVAYANTGTSFVSVHVIDSIFTSTGTTYQSGSAALAANLWTDATIEKCSVLGCTITGARMSASFAAFAENSGLVCQNYSNATIIQTSAVSGSACGGIIAAFSASEVCDNLFYGSISAEIAITGGGVGNASFATVEYNVCAVSPQNKGNGFIGTLTGGTFSGNAWDITSSGINYDPTATGRTTAELQNIETYTVAGQSIASFSNYVDEIWKISDGNDAYPIQGWMEIPAADGVNVSAQLENTPQTIAIAAQSSISSLVVSVVLENAAQFAESSVSLPLNAQVEVFNTPQTLAAGTAGEAIGIAALTNAQQTIQSNAVNLVAVVSDLENAQQTIQSNAVNLVAVVSDLENAQQTIQADIGLLIFGSGDIINTAQIFAATSKYETTAYGILQNVNQFVASVVKSIVSVESSAQNTSQALQGAGTTNNEIHIDFGNSAQIIIVSAHISIVGSGQLVNKAQTFAAYSEDVRLTQIALENAQQTIAATISDDVSISGGLVNNEQSAQIEGFVFVRGEASLGNSLQTIAIECALHPMEAHVVLVNAPQIIHGTSPSTIIGSAAITNDAQQIESTLILLSITIWIGRTPVSKIFVRGQEVTNFIYKTKMI